MTRDKVGLALFWLGALYAFVWAVPVGAYLNSVIGEQTLEELNQTRWAPTGFLFNLWGFSPPGGALAAGVGLLLRSGAGTGKILGFGVGTALAVFVSVALADLGHFPPLFGLGGGVIVLCFVGVLWFWGQERLALGAGSTAAADLRLVGYVFLFIAAWFSCGAASGPFVKPFVDAPPVSPIYVMGVLVLGWLFLLASHHQASRARPAEASPTAVATPSIASTTP